MAHEAANLTPAELADRAWKLAEKIRIGLFATRDGTQQRIRPLSATIDRDAGSERRRRRPALIHAAAFDRGGSPQSRPD